MSTQTYPLAWPVGWQRTEKRTHSRYSVSGDAARKHLLNELRLMGVTDIVLSSNVRLRNDGQPYASEMGRRYDDPGVAVYFTRTNKDGTEHQQVLACDKWLTVDDNIRALGIAAAAMRDLERTGASDLLDRAFSGFKALPQHAGRCWWDVLGVDRYANTSEVRTRYYELAREHHPDRGGDASAMAEVTKAYGEFTSERGL